MKSVPPVTEKKPDQLKSEPAKIAESPQIEQQKPLSDAEWKQKIEAQMAMIEQNFNALGTFVQQTNAILGKLSQPQQDSGNQEMLARIVDKALSGEGSNPLMEKMNTFYSTVLDKAIANIQNPEKPLIQKYLEEETAKKIARKLAEEP